MRTQGLVATATVIMLSCSFIPSSWAKPVPEEKDDIRGLIIKAFDGTMTSDEKDLLVTIHPDVSAFIPDMGRTGEGSLMAASTFDEIPDSLASMSCFTYTGWNTYWSLLGNSIYRFEHKATACSNGSVMTSHSTPTYTMSNIDPTIANWTVVEQAVSGVNTSQSTSRIQLRVSHCILQYGCFEHSYPTGTIVAKYNNTADITTTVPRRERSQP